MNLNADKLLGNFANELDFGSTLTLEQKLEAMTILANAIYITKQEVN